MKEPEEMFSIKGEPVEVYQARMKILKEFEDLEFYEDGHHYLLNGKELASASSIGERFVSAPFDEQKQAVLYAEKHGETPEHWIKEWRENSFRASTLGTKTHAYGESLSYLLAGYPEKIRPEIRSQYMEEYGYLAPIHPKEEAVMKFLTTIPSCMHLVLNEAKVYSGKNPDPTKNLKEQLCGTFDMLYYYDGEGNKEKAGFLILDYKTNSRLYNEYNKKERRMLLEPFGYMTEEDFSLYTIQLSLYALMVEDIGLKILGRRIIWLNEDGNFQKIKVPDVSNTLRDIL